MNTHLKLKTETAFRDYLAPHFKIKVYAGHDTDEEIGEGEEDKPNILVWCNDATTFEDMPPETGCWLIPTIFQVQWPVSLLLDHASGIENTLHDLMSLLTLEKVQAKLNKPDSGIDDRKVKNFHLYDYFPTTASDTREEEWIIENYEVGILCGAHN